MFYLNYLVAELTRRWGKTLTMTIGLGMAAAIIISIISLSQSLSTAQNKVLNPLQNVGTDLIVSKSVDSGSMKELDQATRDELMSENRISTDLSKLGNPGDNFSTDSFQSGSMLSFSADVTKNLNSNIKDHATGLFLNVTHQEGKIPKVTAEFQTGGEKIQVEQNVTSEQRNAMQEAFRKAEESVRAKGLDPRSPEGRKAMEEVMGDSMPSFKTEVMTPNRTYTKDLGPISTDIKTENLTIAGVEVEKKNIGLILPSQITKGKFFEEANQIIINETYASKKGIKIGDEYTLAGRKLSVIGFVNPKLYTNTADLYLTLNDLQTIAGRENKINVLLIKAKNSDQVAKVKSQLIKLFTGAKVTDSSDTAKQVSGSLVSAANLTNRFIGITSIIVILAAFVIVSLLTLLSVNKRVREIGTMKAIGWQNSTIVRQILLENIATGLLGAILGIILGILGVKLLNMFNISLGANIQSANTAQIMMRRFVEDNKSATLQTAVDLRVNADYLILGLGAAVSLAGSIFAGAIAAIKSSRMRAQEALRNLE